MKRSIIFLGLLLAGCSDNAPKGGFEPPPTPVLSTGIEVQDVPLYFEAIGVIKAHQTAEVKPQVNGIITEVHFTEGQQVEKGTLLYTIEEAPYAIKAQEMEALIAHDQANLSNAVKKLDRYKSLTTQDLIAKVEWDEMETKIALLESVVKADEAKLSAAKLDLEHCRIVAPISGRTGKTSLQTGSTVSMQTVLVTLSQANPLYVDFTMTEKELQQLRTASPPLEVYIAGSEDRLAVGKVSFLDHSIDSKSGLLATRGVLTRMIKPLWPGQSVRVHVLYGKSNQAKLIPVKAVKTNQSGPYIFSIKTDKSVELRNVKLGQEDKGLVIVQEGLDGVDKVVTEGHLRLFPGAKVEEVQEVKEIADNK